MKKIVVPIIALVAVLYSCGPAAEDRERMDYVAKRTADSIARGLDSCLTDPIKENVFKNAQAAPPVNTVAAQPTATTGK